jgi:hypothetical protein
MQQVCYLASHRRIFSCWIITSHAAPDESCCSHNTYSLYQYEQNLAYNLVKWCRNNDLQGTSMYSARCQQGVDRKYSAAKCSATYFAIRECGCFVIGALRAAVVPLQNYSWLFCHSGAEPGHEARDHFHDEGVRNELLAAGSCAEHSGLVFGVKDRGQGVEEARSA